MWGYSDGFVVYQGMKSVSFTVLYLDLLDAVIMLGTRIMLVKLLDGTIWWYETWNMISLAISGST